MFRYFLTSSSQFIPSFFVSRYCLDLYGKVRGLYAWPLKILTPFFFKNLATLKIRFLDSTPFGPAIIGIFLLLKTILLLILTLFLFLDVILGILNLISS